MEILNIVNTIFRNLNKAHRSGAFIELQKETRKEIPVADKEKLELLAGIFSLTLAPEDVARPFHPIWVGADGSTSFALENIPKERADFLQDIGQGLADHGGKSQIFDILWILTGDYKHAILAIQEYKEYLKELFASKNLYPATKPLERSLNIMRFLNHANHPEDDWIDFVVAEISSLAPEYVEHYNLLLNVFSILERRKINDTILPKLAPLAYRFAEAVKGKGHFLAQHDFLLMASSFSRKMDDDIKYREFLVLAAKVFEDASDFQSEAFAKCNLLERAISDLRKAGDQQEKAQELHKKLLAAQKGKLEALHRFKLPDVDMSVYTKKAEVHVTRQNFIESVLYFTHVAPLPDYAEEKKKAVTTIQEFPFQHLFKKVILDHDAKTVAQVPPVLPELGAPTEQRKAIWDQVMLSIRIHQDLYTHGAIIPALLQINRTHSPSYHELVRLFKGHPFLDLGREILVAKGIYYGFLNQWPEALHFLIPQLEHAIRFVLKNSGVIVSKYDDQGNQEDLNLNEMIYKKETREIFGEDLTLDLSVLLVDKYGSNLRNLLAHGLMPIGHFYITDSIYLWWLITKLFFLPVNLKVDTKESRAAEENEKDKALGKENAAPPKKD